jgi:hypothetical protein
VHDRVSHKQGDIELVWRVIALYCLNQSAVAGLKHGCFASTENRIDHNYL